jgi:hypothetical protein
MRQKHCSLKHEAPDVSGVVQDSAKRIRHNKKHKQQQQIVDPELQVLIAEQTEHKENTEEHTASADDQTALILPSDDNHRTRSQTRDETQQDPLKKLSLFNFTMKYFSDCRITPDLRISIHDAIAKFCCCTKKDAKYKFRELGRLQNSQSLSKHQFHGQGQRLTPVCTFSQLLGILSRLPRNNAELLRREKAEILRREKAEIASCSVAGGRDMEDEIHRFLYIYL